MYEKEAVVWCDEDDHRADGADGGGDGTEAGEAGEGDADGDGTSTVGPMAESVGTEKGHRGR